MNWMNSTSGVVVLVGNASRDGVTPQRSLSNQARILCLKYPDPSSIPMRPTTIPYPYSNAYSVWTLRYRISQKPVT